MSLHVAARRASQRLGIEPRYLRRFRWISKAAAVRGAGGYLHRSLGFVLLDPEPHNFTYELANEGELAAFVATATGVTHAQAGRLLAEGRDDQELARRLEHATARHWLWSKRSPPFGKRLGWYAIARALKPLLAVESGVHDGLGSLVILRALERNAQEGISGRLVSFDINPSAGWMVGAHPQWELRIEATRVGLPSVLAGAKPLGLFVHDSWHSYENERLELRTAAARLSDPGVLISDNAHVTPALAETCEAFGLSYSEFRERPLAHFYPGGTVGAGSRLGGGSG